MKLQQLRYVVKVAECGSITEASRRLFVSQPSITASIRDLENEMGVHIFERTNKGVIVSEEGETFLGYARQVLDQADLLEGKYKGESEQVPHFSVSCQHYSFAVNAFVDVIREFDAARYDFTLREEQTHEIIEDVAHMKSELGILYLSEHNREVIERMLAANELVFEGLFCATPHVFVCADHPLAGRSSVTLEDRSMQGSFSGRWNAPRICKRAVICPHYMQSEVRFPSLRRSFLQGWQFFLMSRSARLR